MKRVKPDYGPVRTAHFGDLSCDVIRDVANRVTYYAPPGTRRPVQGGVLGPAWVPDEGDFLHVIQALRRAMGETRC